MLGVQSRVEDLNSLMSEAETIEVSKQFFESTVATQIRYSDVRRAE